MELIGYLVCLTAIAVGFIIGHELAQIIVRHRTRQANRRIVQERLAELSNGRKTEHLTVDPELLS